MAKIRKQILGTVLAAGIIASAGGSYLISQQNNYEMAPTVSYSQREGSAGDIVIWSPWTANGAQDTALQNIVKDWNENQAADAGFNVSVSTIDGGYSGLTEMVEKDVKAGDSGLGHLPNMYVNYADTTSVLLESGDNSYALDLTNEDKVGAGNSLDASLFVDGALTDSALMAGGEEDAIYSIPMAMSSELMGINVPLFTWMLQAYAEAGGTVEISGEVAEGIAGKLGVADASGILTAEISDEDRGLIETNWKAEGTTSGTLTITDDTFESAKAMTAMTDEILTVVKDTNKDLSKDSSQGVIGIDASANEFYVFGQEITQSFTNPENGLLSIDENGEVSYNMVEADTEAQEAAKEIWDFFTDGFATGSLWNPNGDYMYGSDQFNTHKLAFSIGSTAGATYYFNNSDPSTVNPQDIYYTQAPGRFAEDSTNTPVRMKQGPSFGAVDKSNLGADGDLQNQNTAIFMDWLVEGEISNITNQETTYITLDNFDTYASEIFPDATDVTVEENGIIAEDPNGTAVNVTTTIDGVTYESGEQLGDSGLTWGVYSGSPELYNYDESNTTGMSGAYFNGVHTNGAYKHVLSESSFNGRTPADYMSVASGYLVGTNEVLGAGSAFSDAVSSGQETVEVDGKTEFVSSGTIGASIAYENFTSTTSELEQEPYGIHTAAFRSEITSEVREAFDATTKGKEVKSSDEFIISVHDEAVREGWMDGELWGDTGLEWWAILLIVLASLTVIGLIAFLVYWFVFKEKNTL